VPDAATGEEEEAAAAEDSSLEDPVRVMVWPGGTVKTMP